MSKPDVTGISVVSKPSEMKAFLNLPYRIYADEPNWVPPLYIQQRDLLDRGKNPYFRDAEAEYFLAYHNGRVCGRIAAIKNDVWIKHRGEETGFFGFFESENRPATAKLLLEVASEWLRDRGVKKMIGPINPGFMYEIGSLVEGHDKPNFIMMPWNKSYNDQLYLSAGLQKEMDLLAYIVDEETVAMDRILRAEAIVKRRLPGINIRPVKMKNFKEEAETIRNIFNAAWAGNWGFSPIGKHEFDHIAKDLKLILDKDLAFVAEDNGKPVGFSVALPDLNQALIHVKNGKLLPFGVFKLLFYKRKIDRVRTALMGVIPEYRGKGIDALLHRETITRGIGKGYYSSELSWLLETNTEMVRVAEKIGASLDKRYRIYGKKLG